VCVGRRRRLGLLTWVVSKLVEWSGISRPCASLGIPPKMKRSGEPHLRSRNGIKSNIYQRVSLHYHLSRKASPVAFAALRLFSAVLRLSNSRSSDWLHALYASLAGNTATYRAKVP
jgi:hypothetical protein